VVDTADAISNTNQKKLTKTFQELAQGTDQEVRMVAIRRLDYGATVDSLVIGKEVAKSIVDETVGYNIRKGDKYNQAFLDAGDRLVAVLSGQEDPGPPVMEDEIQIESTFTKAEDTDQGSATIWVIGFLIVATVIPMATYYWYVGFGN